MIYFSTSKGWGIPEGNVVQVADAIGRVIWLAIQKVKVTITSEWLGMNGDSASITVNSSMPFAPDPSNPSYTTKTWTVSVADQPNCTIEIPVGSTIECTVSRDKGNADSYIKLNGLKEVTGDGTYVYTVTRDVTITLTEKYSQGDYGMITIVETGADIVSDTVILQVEKITSDTYAGETTYTGEQFILLDIYPTTNGTVKVTYGGLTKTIMDTSGAEEPNAQQVFFGTFNGVADSVATPASGELTIEGDCRGFGIGSFATSSKSTSNRKPYVTAITNLGSVEAIPYYAFASCEKIPSVTIPSSVKTIGNYSFTICKGLESIKIPSSVVEIGISAFTACSALADVILSEGLTKIGNLAFVNCNSLTAIKIPSSVVEIGSNPFYLTSNHNIITVADGNSCYEIDGNCLIEMSTNRIVSGFGNSTIPASVTSIGAFAFSSCTGLTSVTIPASVTTIETSAFSSCTGLTSVTIPASVTTIGTQAFTNCTGLTSVTMLATTPPTVTGTEFNFTTDIGTATYPIIVPKGCGDIYKSATNWSKYADRIVEES